MLNSINLDDKSYEDLIAEALAKIPLYSGEWTNFNRSDPGVTILQNLSSFTLLQRGSVNRVTDEIRRGLLRLAGCKTERNGAASLLVRSPEEDTVLPPQYQLRIGDLCFETERETPLSSWGLEAVYLCQDGNFQDITMLLETEAGTAAVFGSAPQSGNALYCILRGVPETEKPLLLWAQAAGSAGRTPFPEKGGPVFARTRWQYFTEGGWVDADAQDETHGFLTSGKITLTLEEEPAVFEDAPVSGCAFRCLLEECEYDRAPRLETLTANLFPVRQWETRVWTYRLRGERTVSIRSPLAEQGNLFVFCREIPGGPYRLYAPFTGVIPTGRLYLREEIPGGVRLNFHQARFGFAPCEEDGAVLVTCFDDEMIHHRELGPVLGFEDQDIAVDLVRDVLADRFLLIAETAGPDGEAEYYPVEPDTDGAYGLRYRVDPEQGLLHIEHPGAGTGCRLYLASCCTTAGSQGNIRAGSTLLHTDPMRPMDPPHEFRGVSPGMGGTDYETVEQLRARFAASVLTPGAAVMPGDYESLVLRTPGLCIHKVRATAFPQENLVRIAVKPRGTDPLPKLSDLYLEEIHAWLEPRRMLTTRVELVQPNYVAVDVWAVLQIKGYYGDVQEAVESMLRQSLDYVNGPQPFGSRIRFSTLYQELLTLPYVESVVEFKLNPQSWNGVSLDNPDLILDPYTLCCPGNLHIQLQTWTAQSL